MDNPMMHGGQGHASNYFISAYGGGGPMDQKIYNNPLISGGLNLSQNGLSLSNGNNGTESSGIHHSQYHHPIMIPMSMVDRSPTRDILNNSKGKRDPSSPPLTSTSEGSFETDIESPSSWTPHRVVAQVSTNVTTSSDTNGKKKRRTTTESPPRSSPAFQQHQLVPGAGIRTIKQSTDHLLNHHNQDGQHVIRSGPGRPSNGNGTERRPFACEQCPKRFAQKAGLVQHERRHSGERPFPCRHCDKKFTQKSGLVQHERLHTGEKPYECQDCDKKFTQKSGLVQHVRTHSGEKPYKCQVCMKCFTQLSGLKQHGKVHSRSS